MKDLIRLPWAGHQTGGRKRPPTAGDAACGSDAGRLGASAGHRPKCDLYTIVGGGSTPTAVRDILIKDCEGYNSFDSHSFYQEFTGTVPFAFTGGLEYANGHVFTTEEFDYNIEFEGCGGSGSHDSIFDLKIGLGVSGLRPRQAGPHRRAEQGPRGCR